MVNINRVRRQAGILRNSYFYYLNGYRYHRNNIKKNTVYFKCAHYERGCNGRALYNRTGGFRHTKCHDVCRRDPYYPLVQGLRQRILQRCRRLHDESFRHILVEESRRFPVEVKKKVRMRHIRSAMQKARYSMYPPPPRNLRQLTALLQHPRFKIITSTEDADDNLYAGSVTAADGSHHIILMSRRMARVAKSLSMLFGDGTFKTLPVMEGLDEASQIFALTGNWDHTVIALGWVLMERRTTEAYTAVFRTVKVLLKGTPILENFMTDFEAALRAGLKNCFPGVDLYGCFFHLINAFIRYAKEELLMYHLLKVEPYMRLMKLCCALPLLPEDDIVQGFRLILRQARQCGLQVYRNMRPFFGYLYRRWVGHPVRREWMCVYDCIHRSNNTAESHNRMLLNFVKKNHPNIYYFLSCLVSMEANSNADVEALKDGEKPNPKRKLSSIALDQRVKNLARGLVNPPGDRNEAIIRYLNGCVYTFDLAYDRIVEAR